MKIFRYITNKWHCDFTNAQCLLNFLEDDNTDSASGGGLPVDSFFNNTLNEGRDNVI